MTRSYKDLIVWQKSVALVIEVYKLTESFPRNEQFGLTSQMRRAAVSIPSNIAEGKLRGHTKECRQFFFISFGSGGELETQVEIAKHLYKEKGLDFTKTDSLLGEVMKMLNKFLSTLEPSA
ncbi:MAG: four helix bundle protein [bacterium]|nr:four helix bundle protein [bacterium]